MDFREYRVGLHCGVYCILLYNLPDSYKDNIKILVRRIFKSLQDDILQLSKKDITISDDILSEIVYLELDGKVYI